MVAAESATRRWREALATQFMKPLLQQKLFLERKRKNVTSWDRVASSVDLLLRRLTQFIAAQLTTIKEADGT